MSNEKGLDTDQLLFRRSVIKDMRKKRDESKVSYDEIQVLKSEIYALGEDIIQVKVFLK